MALWDKNNPGKNLANATIWLESASDSGSGGDSGGCGCSPFLVGALIAAVVLAPSIFVSCATLLSH